MRTRPRPANPVIVPLQVTKNRPMCLASGELLVHRIWLDAYHAADDAYPEKYADECVRKFEARFPGALWYKRGE